MGRCPMGIDIADIVRRDSAVRNGSKHAFCRHLPARIRSRDVIGITVIAVADDFGIDMGTAFFCVFQFFKDNDTRAFAHNKTASFFIKGARCLFRFLIIAGQCLHVIKASDGHFSNGSLTAPGKHDIGLDPFQHTSWPHQQKSAYRRYRSQRRHRCAWDFRPRA